MEQKKSQIIGISEHLSEISGAEFYEFIAGFIKKMDKIGDLAVKNSVIFSSFDKENQFMYYDSVLKEMLDVKVIDGVKKSHFDFFVYRMRLAFLRNYAIFMNFIVTPGRYAKFCGKPEITIRSWMEAGKFEVIFISGKKFILIPENEMMDYNAFLMEEYLKGEAESKKEEKEKISIGNIYRQLYGDDIETENTVALFFRDMGYFRESYNRGWKEKRYVQKSYIEYSKWCLKFGKKRVTDRAFSAMITKMGFKRFNTRKRGFYVWIMPEGCLIPAATAKTAFEFFEEEKKREVDETKAIAVPDDGEIDFDLDLEDLMDDVPDDSEEDDSWLPDFSKGSEV